MVTSIEVSFNKCQLIIAGLCKESPFYKEQRKMDKTLGNLQIERISYNKAKIEMIREKVQKMIAIVAELELEFPGRHFTLDGHLVGSIGEVMAAYYYGIELYKASSEKHDGIVDGREVQIKTTQQDDIVINAKPDYLLVLYLTKKGDVYEVYNGTGEFPWKTASKRDSHNNRHMRVNKLMELDTMVPAEDRIKRVHSIEKMRKEYKNRKRF